MSKGKEKSFEEALKRLEAIVQTLEGNTGTLDESLALYEEGKTLIAFCAEKLNAAEQKVKVLSLPENH